MLAALLLNQGNQGTPPVKPRFGGGPFWSRYGYDEKLYDQTTTTALPATEVSDPIRPLPRIPSVAPINYKLVEKQVYESVSKDLKLLHQKRMIDDEDEEIEVLMLFMSQ